MQARNYGVPRTDAERAVFHYGITEAEYNANPSVYPLPSRGEGMTRQKRYPFREHITTIAAGTLDYLKCKQVPNGEVWVYETIAYENETGARGTFRRYIERGAEKHYIAELQGPGADELIFSDKSLTLLPGERLVVQQASCTASDVLQLYTTGYRIFTKEAYLEVD